MEIFSYKLIFPNKSNDWNHLTSIVATESVIIPEGSEYQGDFAADNVVGSGTIKYSNGKTYKIDGLDTFKKEIKAAYNKFEGLDSWLIEQEQKTIPKE